MYTLLSIILFCLIGVILFFTGQIIGPIVGFGIIGGLLARVLYLLQPNKE